MLINPSLYIYSRTRLQIIRWNKSREASAENEEKQKGQTKKDWTSEK